MGGADITIVGSGFSRDVYTLGNDPNKGNHLVIYSSDPLIEVVLDVFMNDANENSITATVPYADYLGGGAGRQFKLALKVDGKWLDSDRICRQCHLTLTWLKTPALEKIYPVITPPGSVIGVEGRIFTDGLQNARRTEYQMEKSFATGVEENAIISKAWFNGVPCNKYRDEITGDLYGAHMDMGNDFDPDRDFHQQNAGTFYVKLGGSQVGYGNFSFLVSEDYGYAEFGKESLQIGANMETYHIQTYAHITSISPQTGSNMGGTRLTVEGKNLDAGITDKRVIAFNGKECRVIESESTPDRLICETPTEPEKLLGFYVGNHGFTHEFTPQRHQNAADNLNSQQDFYDDYEALMNETPRDIVPDNTWTQMNITHGTGFYSEHGRPVVMDYGRSYRHKAFFVAPMKGPYQVSTKMDWNRAIFINGTEVSRRTDELAAQLPHNNDQKIGPILFMEKGEMIPIVAYDYQREGQWNTMKMEIWVHIINSPYSQDDVKYNDGVMRYQGEKPIHTWEIEVDNLLEKQSIEFVNMDAVTASGSCTPTVIKVCVLDQQNVFQMTYYGMKSEKFSRYTSDSDFQAALSSLPLLKDATVTSSESAAGCAGNEFSISLNQKISDTLPKVKAPVEQISISLGSTGTCFTDQIVLGMNGFSLGTATSQTTASLKSGIEELLATACPAGLHHWGMNNPTVVHWETFDDDAEGDPSTFYCGSKSKNIISDPNIYWSQHWKRNYQFCFAYKGKANQEFVIYAYFRDRHRTVNEQLFTVPVELPEANSWSWHCTDLKMIMFAHFENDLGWDTSGSTLLSFKRVGVVPQGDFWVDNVYVGDTPPDTSRISELHDMRVEAKAPAAEEITVTGTGPFEVTYKAHGCAVGYGLVEVIGVDDVNIVSEDEKIFRDSNWPAGSYVKVTRTQAASTPLSGTFNVEFVERESLVVNIPALVFGNTVQTKYVPLSVFGVLYSSSS